MATETVHSTPGVGRWGGVGGRGVFIPGARVDRWVVGGCILLLVLGVTPVTSTGQKIHSNVTQILDNLLLGYDNMLRPGFGGRCLSINYFFTTGYCQWVIV